MARPLRIEFHGAAYHITVRGNEKVMYNHYHLLIETPEGNLSQGMKQLNGT